MNTYTPTAIVTGASSGIGFSIVEAFAALGYKVGNARTAQRLERAAARLIDRSRFIPVAGDIGERAVAQALFDTAIAAFGAVDILVNCAGEFIAKPIQTYTEDDLSAMIVPARTVWTRFCNSGGLFQGGCLTGFMG
jgi:NAD(P)-dependent dehydrogenase (short-subunit alcohol dehydrogenase family)